MVQKNRLTYFIILKSSKRIIITMSKYYIERQRNIFEII